MEPCEGGSLLMTEYDGDARLEASACPLIVFVRVPKTAGSMYDQETASRPRP